MEKSIFSREYGVFLRQLREARRAAGLTQVEMAARLDEDQSWISRVETGERRLDVIELRAFCAAVGVPVLQFMEQLEAALGQPDEQQEATETADA